MPTEAGFKKAGKIMLKGFFVFMAAAFVAAVVWWAAKPASTTIEIKAPRLAPTRARAG
jgi:hypothetical protein